jgi:hypothetical protein
MSNALREGTVNAIHAVGAATNGAVLTNLTVTHDGVMATGWALVWAHEDCPIKAGDGVLWTLADTGVETSGGVSFYDFPLIGCACRDNKVDSYDGTTYMISARATDGTGQDILTF